MRAMFADCDTKVLKQLMDINFWGAVYCTKHALPYLMDKKGAVVAVSSVAGLVGLPDVPPPAPANPAITSRTFAR